jgi:cobalt-zinc-cadmium efflux system membrane fusion protein
MMPSKFLTVTILGFAVVVALTWWGRGDKPADSHGASDKGTGHAAVAVTVDEASLNIIKLSAVAAQRLGMETQAIERREMPRLKPYGAELTLPTGAAVVVTSPLAGTIQVRSGSTFPKVGEAVEAEQPLLLLMPMLTPEREVLTTAERIRFAEAKATVAQSQIDADGLFQQAAVQVEAAKIALDRAERLHRDNVGTLRAVDEAKAQLDVAVKAHDAARQRKALVDNIKLDEEAGTLEPLTITSPLKGIVRATQVQAGQIVSNGAPLFEVMNDDKMWVKTPIYVGELELINPDASVRVTEMNGVQSDTDVEARPISLPPTAAPLSSSVDVYYEVDNADHRFRPGERVVAYIPLKGETKVDAVPWSSVYHDVYGGQWVYEDLGEYRYARRRVEVGWVQGDWAALLRGPSVGTRVLVSGVAELSGVEFGFAK